MTESGLLTNRNNGVMFLGIPTFLRYQGHLLSHCVGQCAQAF